MNVLEGQLTFKFRERLYTLPYFTKQLAHTPFVDSHPLRRRWPLELEPASKQHFTTPVVVASSTLLQKVLWSYKTEFLEAEYILDKIYPSWWSF